MCELISKPITLNETDSVILGVMHIYITNFRHWNQKLFSFIFQFMYKQRIDVKSIIFCQIEQTGLDTATAHLRTEKLSLLSIFIFVSTVLWIIQVIISGISLCSLIWYQNTWHNTWQNSRCQANHKSIKVCCCTAILFSNSTSWFFLVRRFYSEIL